MMFKKIAFLLGTTFAIVGFIFVASSPSYAKTVMNIGYSVNEGHPYGTFMNTFADRFMKLSGGKVKVKVHCCHKMGSEQEQFKKLQLGTLDGTLIAQNNSGPFFPKIDLLVLPYMIQNLQHGYKVVDGPVGKMIWGDMPAKAKVHLVKISLISFRHVYNSKKPINSLADFAPMKWRVPKNVVMVDTYKAFGSDPVPMAWSETLTAVQTGTVDGGDLPADVIYAQKFHDVAKHLAVTGHFALTPPFFVSDKFMKKLSPDLKEALYTAADIAAAASRYHTESGETVVFKKLKASGVKITHPNKAEWIAAAAKVHADFAKKRGAEYVKLISAINAAAEGTK